MGKFTLQFAVTFCTVLVLIRALVFVYQVAVCRSTRNQNGWITLTLVNLMLTGRYYAEALALRIWTVRTIDRLGTFYEVRSGHHVRGWPFFGYDWTPKLVSVACIDRRLGLGPPGPARTQLTSSGNRLLAPFHV